MASLKHNTAGQNFTFCLVSATTGAGVAGATVTTLVTKDGGAQAAGGGTVTSQGSGQYNYAPTQAETNATDVGFFFSATGCVPVNLDFHTDIVDGNGLPSTNVADWNGTTVATPATAGIPDVNAKNINNVSTSSVTTINANQGTTQPLNFVGTGGAALVKTDLEDIAGSAVTATGGVMAVNTTQISGTAQTARDLGASVLLSPGTGTGQLNISGGNLAGPVPSVSGAVGSVTGNVGGNVTGSVGSVLGNVAGSVGAVVGDVGGDLLGNVDGHVVGSVGSVVGNVGGNVVGSVASVTGAVGSVTGNVGGNVAGSVASVSGNVGGNVAGSVASVTNPVTVSGTVAANVTAINGSTNAALNVQISGDDVGRGQCAAGGTLTSIPTAAWLVGGSSVNGAVDQYKGRVVVFDYDTTTVTLRGQACSITDNTSGTTPTFTLDSSEPLTTAPVAGDTFSVF